MRKSPGLSPFPMREYRNPLFKSKSYGLDGGSDWNPGSAHETALGGHGATFKNKLFRHGEHGDTEITEKGKNLPVFRVFSTLNVIYTVIGFSP
jgi:hypothetical protein